MRVGASYYPEATPREEWERDLATGREIGLSCLRCGEFAWSAFEPEEGHWKPEWALEFLDLAHKYDYAVVWCTPSATPPPFFFDRWPDLNAVSIGGAKMAIGNRRHYCPSHEGYRQRSAEMAERIAQTVSQHPALIGWQVDNEIAGDGFTCWCERCQRAFHVWLQHRYKTLDALNNAWQTMVWSQRYTAWHQVPLPLVDTAPALKMAYRRFRSDNWLAFYRAQADELHKHSKLPVSTNFYNYSWHVPVDQWAWRKELDAISVSHYLEDADASRFQLAVLRAGGEKPLWVLEQKAGQQAAQNLLPDDPERIFRHLKICAQSGAELAIYWHLRQHSAHCEMEHGAVLRHDGKPGRIARTIKKAITRVTAEAPRPVGKERLLAFSFEQFWAQEQRPPQVAPWHYCHTVQEWHSAAARVWGDMPVGPFSSICQTQSLVVAPHVQMREPGVVERLFDYAREGGTLVTTADFARVDVENNIIREAPCSLLNEDLPPLEMLTIKPDYPLRGSIGNCEFAAKNFWCVADEGYFTAEQTIGALNDGHESGPLAVRIPLGKGQVILVMAEPDRAGLEALFKSL